MSSEQVVEQMFDESEGEENSEEVNVGERLKRGLSSRSALHRWGS
jgi:hypothetical protein